MNHRERTEQASRGVPTAALTPAALWAIAHSVAAIADALEADAENRNALTLAETTTAAGLDARFAAAFPENDVQQVTDERPEGDQP